MLGRCVPYSGFMIILWLNNDISRIVDTRVYICVSKKDVLLIHRGEDPPPRKGMSVDE